MTDPKAISRMMIATRMPISSPLGGSWPANARICPFAPMVTPFWPFAASTSSTIVLAVSVGTSVALSNVMVA